MGNPWDLERPSAGGGAAPPLPLGERWPTQLPGHSAPAWGTPSDLEFPGLCEAVEAGKGG